MSDIKIIADLKEREQSRVAMLEDGKLSEIFIEYNFEASRTQGDIFKARVETVVPAISAIFVSISTKKQNKLEPHNAFLYLNETEQTSKLKPGNELIVQITKNARKNKAPRVSSKISIPGRWLVLVPNSDEIGVSRRIDSFDERKRLKQVANKLTAENPGFGVIIRTAADGISEELLYEDFKSLLNLWYEICKKYRSNSGPCLLYRDIGTLGRVLRDEVVGEIDEIIIDNAEEYEHAQNFVEKFFSNKPDIKFYNENTPIFEYFGIEPEIQKALERKVWLRSGAYLVFDQTEALTVIDVNTGKFTSASDMRHTILETNLEAAQEIARQLRLRSIGGIIIVDFIDMDFSEDKATLLKSFEKFLSYDRLKARVFSITQLGLVELTRKREHPDLKSVLMRSCPLCGDNGFIEKEENIAINIKRFIRKIINANNSEIFLIQSNIHIANYINQNFIDDWKKEFGRKIFVEGVSGFVWNKYRLEYQGNAPEELGKTIIKK
ncbi:MAG: Rne/Rng family ribonuclease [Synergistaceae bacterium]|nr:Rne/Rng family ribonuclease [Synergistaceae bacterium]